MKKQILLFSCACALFFSCQKNSKQTQFKLLTSQETGISFLNEVKNSSTFNIFNYRNFYNGGGVALGDINNDGLLDIYFTANMGSNKLYLNKGNLEFEDITEKAGVALEQHWSTGVVMADVNADGLLDIYVCNAGYFGGIGQENTLFLNHGNETFSIADNSIGLNDSGYTTHAAFLDYDLDGDLDAYILNNSFIPVNTLNHANNRELRAENWPVKDYLKGGGDKLLRNDGKWEDGIFKPKYVDVSEKAGIYGSLIGFGLGVTVGDVNNDHFPDLYISNDFYEKDYLYVNQGNGTFKEEIESRIGHTSFASMGADMADINNDGYQEIFVTDMLPRDDQRLKTTTAFDSHYAYDLRLKRGFYHQYMQNTLQLNNGEGKFSEIANFAGVAASDWSWGALLFDADNDSHTDIYVCNGIQHDVIDQDFIDFFANELNQKMVVKGKKEGIEKILEQIPSKPQPNLFFQNNGDLTFSDVGRDWGTDQLSFSNGAAYGDLDNDGDLDLVVNNVNQEAFVYQNKSADNHFIQVSLKGIGANTKAIGSTVKVHVANQIQVRVLFPNKGFQSSVDPKLTFGLNLENTIDSLEVFWPDKKRSVFKNLQADSLYTIIYEEVEKLEIESSNILSRPFEIVSHELLSHLENDYQDYYNEKNIPFKLSNEGPPMASGDLNGDGMEDLLIGGAKNQETQVYLGTKTGFQLTKPTIFSRLAYYEDTAIHLFDADQDGDLDIYLGLGGNENSEDLRDILLLNEGKLEFTRSMAALPAFSFNTSVIRSLDYDGDGDLDLLVGSRSFPKQYGKKASSFILQNNGKGVFEDVTKKVCPALIDIGMVTDAQCFSMAGKNAFILVGDWMAPRVFQYTQNSFKEQETGLEKYLGFWGAVKVQDFNGDNKPDFILGNIGENFAIPVNDKQPLRVYVGDLDNNGLMDKVFTKVVEGKETPVFLKRELMDQFPALKAKSLKHADYAQKSITDFFPRSLLDKMQVNEANYLSTAVAFSDPTGKYTLKKLPVTAQLSCTNDVLLDDFNQDGLVDILLVGNSKNTIPQFNTLDACRGVYLENRGKAGFKSVSPSGFEVEGVAKSIERILTSQGPLYVISRNNDKPLIFKNKL